MTQRQIQCGDRDFVVTVKRSRRRRTVALSIGPSGTVTVYLPAGRQVLPYFVWGPFIDRFVRKQAAWISKKLELFQKRASNPALTYPKAWCKAHVEERLREPLERYAAAMRLAPKRVSVSHQRTRWGSCSARGDLRFSSRLAMVPQAIFEYVMVHELAHMKELNHSKRFWTVVETHCPDYRFHRKWLREQGWQAVWNDER